MDFGGSQCVNIGSSAIKKKCTILVGDVDPGEGYAFVGGQKGYMGNLCTFCSVLLST